MNNKNEVCIGEEYYLQLIDKVNEYDKLKELYEKMYNENCILRENAEHNDKVVDKVNWKLNKYKEVIDKALYWLSENTHYTDFSVEKLVLDENVNLKELLELLEEIDEEKKDD